MAVAVGSVGGVQWLYLIAEEPFAICGPPSIVYDQRGKRIHGVGCLEPAELGALLPPPGFHSGERIRLGLVGGFVPATVQEIRVVKRIEKPVARGLRVEHVERLGEWLDGDAGADLVFLFVAEVEPLAQLCEKVA